MLETEIFHLDIVVEAVFLHLGDAEHFGEVACMEAGGEAERGVVAIAIASSSVSRRNSGSAGPNVS